MEIVEGRTAFVTGGASGIGLGMATAFVDARMNVVIADLRRDHIETALAQLEGKSVHAIELDVTDRDGVRGARPRRQSGSSATCTLSATTRAWASSGRSRSPGTTTGTGDWAC